MTLRRIRLELARCPNFPDGSPERGYEFDAPLTPDGMLDVEAWRAERPRCQVRRFWPGEDDRAGELRHTRRHSWAFSYAPGDADDEDVFKLDGHRLIAGEYVTIREHDGAARTFRVAAVR